MRTLSVGAAAAAIATMLAGHASAVEWSVSLWGERRAFTEHVHKLAKLVEEKTGGEFTMKISYGGLSKSTENLDGISIGAFEMAQFCAGYHPDKNPTLTVLELPYLGVSTLEEAAAASRAVYRHPAVQEDLARWNARLLMPSPMPQYNLAGTGEPRETVEELKGMRVRANGGLAEAFEAFGAVPTALPASETYEAMETGVVDAVAFAPHAHLAFGTINLADWWTANLDVGTLDCPVAVSIDAYEELDPEHREALDSSVGAAVDDYLENYHELLAEWESVLEERNVKRVSFSAGEIEKLHDLAAPVRDRWIEKMKTQGIPGDELYGLVQRTLEEQRASE